MIEADGLTRQFDGLVAVDQLELQVPEGVLFGFLGRNGAGKTTTLKMLSTVLRPTGGTARIKGYDVSREASEVRKLIGVVGEGVETTRPFWTPLEYLGYFLRLRGLSRRETSEIATRWIERLELGDHRHRPIGDFSSGMRKRLELCRAFCHGPELLLLDEPTKDLDAIPPWNDAREAVRSFVSGRIVFRLAVPRETHCGFELAQAPLAEVLATRLPIKNLRSHGSPYAPSCGGMCEC